MSKYDLPPEDEEKPIKPECVHYFNKSTIIQTEYTDDLCMRVIEHGQSGLLIEGFAGREQVCMDAMCQFQSLMCLTAADD